MSVIYVMLFFTIAAERDLTEQNINIRDFCTESNLRVLYHGTTRKAAKSIRDQDFFRSSNVTKVGQDLGPGIYLATDLHEARFWADGANRYAQVYFECVVDVGNVKWIPEDPPYKGHKYDFWQDETEQYDSIHSPKQYALRSNDQILNYKLKEFDNDESNEQKIFIWRDTNIHRKDNAASLSALKNKFQNQGLTIYGVDSDARAFEVINDIPQNLRHTVYVASNRRNGGFEFLSTCRNIKGVTNQMLMYTMSTNGWKRQDWITIDTKSNALERFVEEVVLKQEVFT